MSPIQSKNVGVGLIAPTPPGDETGQIPLRMDVSVLLQFHSAVHVFTRSTASMEIDHPKVTIHKIRKPFSESSPPLRLFGFFLYQIKLTLALLSVRDEIKIGFFRGTGQVIPMVAAKAVRMTVFLRMAGVLPRTVSTNSIQSILLRNLLWGVHSSMCIMSDIIIVTSPYLITFAGLERYEHKVHRWQHYFFDLNKFSVREPYSERETVIGHVGTLDSNKQSTNFAEAMCRVSEQVDISVRVVGDGPLRKDVEEILDDCLSCFEMRGTINRNLIPAELNKMKLLVISSQAEGVPKILIEAMACGTPVIATQVGGIPDYVSDGENGFLIQDSNPETIAKEVLDVLERNDFDEISKASRDSVTNEFTYEKTLEGYYTLLGQTHYSPNRPPKDPSPPIEVNMI